MPFPYFCTFSLFAYLPFLIATGISFLTSDKAANDTHPTTGNLEIEREKVDQEKEEDDEYHLSLTSSVPSGEEPKAAIKHKASTKSKSARRASTPHFESFGSKSPPVPAVQRRLSLADNRPASATMDKHDDSSRQLLLPAINGVSSKAVTCEVKPYQRKKWLSQETFDLKLMSKDQGLTSDEAEEPFV